MSAELRDLLEGAVRGAPGEPYPVAEVVRSARAAQARRVRMLVATGAAAAVAVAGVGYAAVRLGDSGRVPEPAGKVVRLSDAAPAVEGTDYRDVLDLTADGDVPVGMMQPTADGGPVVVGSNPDDEPAFGLVTSLATGEIEWLETPRGTPSSVTGSAPLVAGDQVVWPAGGLSATVVDLTTGERVTYDGGPVRRTVPELRSGLGLRNMSRVEVAGYAGDRVFFTVTQGIAANARSTVVSVGSGTEAAVREIPGWALRSEVADGTIAWTTRTAVHWRSTDGSSEGSAPLTSAGGCRPSAQLSLAVRARRVAVMLECGGFSDFRVLVFDSTGRLELTVEGAEVAQPSLTDDALVLTSDAGGLYVFRFADRAWLRVDLDPSAGWGLRTAGDYVTMRGDDQVSRLIEVL